jgi:hypothetical protein
VPPYTVAPPQLIRQLLLVLPAFQPVSADNQLELLLSAPQINEPVKVYNRTG